VAEPGKNSGMLVDRCPSPVCQGQVVAPAAWVA
jgi:hypothetical protein